MEYFNIFYATGLNDENILYSRFCLYTLFLSLSFVLNKTVFISGLHISWVKHINVFLSCDSDLVTPDDLALTMAFLKLTLFKFHGDKY